MLILILSSAFSLLNAQSSETRIQTISMPQYSATLEPGSPPQIKIAHGHEIVFQSPLVAGLATTSSEETLTDIRFTLKPVSGNSYIVDVAAKSSIWTRRRFTWHLFPDHIEFQQFASGKGKLGRCYFLSNGISNRWDNGTTSGHAWATTIYADRYFLHRRTMPTRAPLPSRCRRHSASATAEKMASTMTSARNR